MLIRFLQNNREASVAIIIVLLLTVLGMVDSSYLSFETVASIYSNSLTLFVVAIGATMVMATRGLDVSVGSIMGLSAAIAGIFMNAHYGIPLSILIALLWWGWPAASSMACWLPFCASRPLLQHWVLLAFIAALCIL